MTGSAWVWVVVAVPLLGAGVWFVARFVVGDRARGRLRCPRCWYDMGGGGEKCPECGRVVRSARELGRSRRRKRWAAAGVGLLVLGGGSLATRQAVVHGAVSLVPNRVLVMGWPDWRWNWWQREVRVRHWRGEFTPSQQGLLFEQAWRTLASSQDAQAVKEAAGLISSAEIRSRTDPWMKSPSECIEPDRLLYTLLRLVRHEDPAIRESLAYVNGDYPREAAILVPVVVTRLVERPVGGWELLAAIDGAIPSRYKELRRELHLVLGGPEGREELLSAVRALSEATLDPARFRLLLLDLVSSEDEVVSALSAWLMRSRYPADEECRAAALSVFDPKRRLAAPTVLDYALRGSLDGAAAEVIRRALRSGEWELVEQAMGGLARRGGEASQFVPDIEAMLGGAAAGEAARTYAMIGGDRERAAWVVLGALYGSDRNQAREVYRLGDIGWLGQPVLHLCRVWLESDHSWARLAAAFVLLKSGTPEGFDRTELTKIAVRALLEDQQSMTRIFWSLVESGQADVPAIIEVLQESDGAAWGELVQMLSNLGSPAESALPWLRRESESDDRNIAYEADLAVRRIEWYLKHGDPEESRSGR
jgi:hypothetical protein